MSSRSRIFIKYAAKYGTVLAGAGVATLWVLPHYHMRRRAKNNDLHNPDSNNSTLMGIMVNYEEVEKCVKPDDKDSQKITTKGEITDRPLLTRVQQLMALKDTEYDVVVVGGGATGCGIALDAVSRGLKTALIEKNDFSAGTSSRSTKLIHGGVRYLQKAIFNLDIEQYNMVKEALSERANLIEIAPHLAYALPIMLPIYKSWQVPYFWAGIKAYDIVSGSQILKPSHYLSKSQALEKFPMLKREKLKGALVYYDGQQNDARMCISIALTAARLGANIANHTEVVSIDKEDDIVNGVTVVDRITDQKISVKAKCVINATGAQTDVIRQLDQPNIKKICQPSAGVHIVLPNYYSPCDMGLLDPNTSDGRVIFFLPWQNSTLAGTTDRPCEVTSKPSPTEEDVQFILSEIKNYLHPDVNVRRGDVLSTWSGIRPLVSNPNAKDTQSLARNHVLEVSPSKMITIAGGKWTTYRLMGEETVDKAVEVCNLNAAHGCRTRGLLLDGAHGWSPTLFIRLIQDYGVDIEVAHHLVNTYGGRAMEVAKVAGTTGKRWPITGVRLHEEYPYLEAEVHRAIEEYACTVVDVIARRTRLAFLNVHAAEEALPRVVDLMGTQLGWSRAERDEQQQTAIQFLKEQMGRNLRIKTDNVIINFSREEVNYYIGCFKSLDQDEKGYITVRDLRKFFEKTHENISDEKLHEILDEVDVNKNSQVDHGEFLQLMSAIKKGIVTTSPFADVAQKSGNLSGVPVSRSGGGL